MADLEGIDPALLLEKAPAFGAISRAQGATTIQAVNNGLVSQISGGQYPTLPLSNIGGNSQAQFGPGTVPAAQPLDVIPGSRQFEYKVGWNIPSTPWSDRAVSWETLKAVSEVEWLTRKAIEVRKDQIRSLHFDIVAKNRKDAFQARKLQDAAADKIETVKKFFRKPDGRHEFTTWIGTLLEDHLVYDAIALEKRRNFDPDAGPSYIDPDSGEDRHLGELIGLDLIHGPTIKAIIDDSGRKPLPPLPAYQQYLYGIPRATFTAQELIYAVKNHANARGPYGFSAVEQFIFMVNMLLRYWANVAGTYTDGTLPEGIAEAPPNWTTQQIGELNEYWDSLLAGDPRALRKLHFVPGGFKWHQFKDPVFDVHFARLLIDMCAVAFDLTAQEMGFEAQHASGSKTQGKDQQDLVARRGPAPLVKWIFDDILNPILWDDFGMEDFEWVTINTSVDEDPDKAKAIQIDMQSGRKSLDQIILEDGGEPIGVGRIVQMGQIALGEPDLKMISKEGWPAFQQKVAAAMPAPDPSQAHGKPLNMQQGKPGVHMPPSGSGPGSPVNPQTNPEDAPNKLQDNIQNGYRIDTTEEGDGTHHRISLAKSELANFRKKAVKAIKAGKSASVKFETEIVDPEVLGMVKSALTKSATTTEVNKVFSDATKYLEMRDVQQMIEQELEERGIDYSSGLDTNNPEFGKAVSQTQPIFNITNVQPPAQVVIEKTEKLIHNEPRIDVNVPQPIVVAKNIVKVPKTKPSVHVDNKITTPVIEKTTVIEKQPIQSDVTKKIDINLTGFED